MPRMRLAADRVAMNQNCGHVCAHGPGKTDSPEIWQHLQQKELPGGRAIAIAAYRGPLTIQLGGGANARVLESGWRGPSRYSRNG